MEGPVALNEDQFEAALLATMALGVRWGLFPPLPGVVKVLNWRFEENEPVGDPGLIAFESGPPGITLQDCTFVRCEVTMVVEKVAALIRADVDRRFDL